MACEQTVVFIVIGGISVVFFFSSYFFFVRRNSSVQFEIAFAVHLIGFDAEIPKGKPCMCMWEALYV